MPDPVIQAAILRANAKGKFIICAAGNDGSAPGQDLVDYPARWRETIAVAAVDRNGQLTSFSSQGDEVDIAAPGQDVLSTYLNGGYAKLSGTSMATPFVAGVTALVLALRRGTNPLPGASLPVPGSVPPASVADLRTLLSQTAIDAGPVGHDPGYGWGLINPDSLLRVTAAPIVAPSPTFTLGGITINGQSGALVFMPSTTGAAAS
jgi:subtilisin family serine protease